MNYHHALTQYLEALYTTKDQAIAAYCERFGILADEVECVFSDYDFENQKITWLCYKRDSFIRWPSQAFIDGPLYPLFEQLNGGTIDLGLSDA